jgi:hypothetical protein
VSAIDLAAGERSKAVALAEVDGTTPDGWKARCDAAIEQLAATGQPFQAADLIEQGLVPEPALPAQWGPRFQAAARRGVIEPCGVARSKRATVRASLCLTWRGRSAA